MRFSSRHITDARRESTSRRSTSSPNSRGKKGRGDSRGSGARRNGSTSWKRAAEPAGSTGQLGSRAGARKAANEARRAFEEAREAREKDKSGRAGCRRVREASRRVETRARRLRPARRRTRQAAGRGRRQRATCSPRRKRTAGALKARVVESRQARDALKRALTAMECSRRMLELSERLEVARLAHAECAHMNDALAGNAAEGQLVDAARRAAAADCRVRGAAVGRGPACVAQLSAGSGRQDEVRLSCRSPAARRCTRPSPSPSTSRVSVPSPSHPGTNEDATMRPIWRRIATSCRAARTRRRTYLDDAEHLHVARREIEGKLLRGGNAAQVVGTRGHRAPAARPCRAGGKADAPGAPAAATLDELETRANECVETLGAAEEKLDLCRARGASGER